MVDSDLISTSASGIIVLLKMPKELHYFSSQALFVDALIGRDHICGQ